MMILRGLSLLLLPKLFIKPRSATQLWAVFALLHPGLRPSCGQRRRFLSGLPASIRPLTVPAHPSSGHSPSSQVLLPLSPPLCSCRWTWCWRTEMYRQRYVGGAHLSRLHPDRSFAPPLLCQQIHDTHYNVRVGCASCSPQMTVSKFVTMRAFSVSDTTIPRAASWPSALLAMSTAPRTIVWRASSRAEAC
jgi:hypothetical protein